MSRLALVSLLLLALVACAFAHQRTRKSGSRPVHSNRTQTDDALSPFAKEKLMGAKKRNSTKLTQIPSIIQTLINAFKRDSTKKVGAFNKLVFSDDFNGNLDQNQWRPMIDGGGCGNGEFQYYTNEGQNLFTKNSILYIKPTFGSGNTPIKSARLHSKFSFKYGRMEIRAKMPKGDQTWPALWLMPRDSKYGNWPLSGEIDVIESRGNAPGFKYGGQNAVGSALHHSRSASDPTHEYFTKQKVKSSGDYHNTFSTYGLVWDSKGLQTYIDNDSNRIFECDFVNQPVWKGQGAKPFDQEFYIIMNVAVGGTNGFFPLGPDTYTSKSDFINKKSRIYNTWGNGNDDCAMQVDWVKVYQ